MSKESIKNGAVLCQSKVADADKVWQDMLQHAIEVVEKEQKLGSLLHDVILSCDSLSESIVRRLSRKLARVDMSRYELEPLLMEVVSEEPKIVMSAMHDMVAIHDRDPACSSPIEPLLFYKGFLAITTYRVAHHLWISDRKPLALYFQSISSEVFGVDIHPAAQIGCGILLDHATSFVVGETAIVEDNVSILHEVTLGGTGKQTGDRHPIVRSGVLIGAGAKILGRVEIGSCAKIGAGSVVLKNVPPHRTVAGVPAVVVGESQEESPALEMSHMIDCSVMMESGMI